MNRFCEECDRTKGVENYAPAWRAGGRNCFDFRWSCCREAHWLCEECAESIYRICDYKG